jgi:O-antigen ligase
VTLLRQGSAGQVLSAEATRDRLAVWCGWALVVGLMLVAPLGWLAPREFILPVTLIGLMGLPAARLRDDDRPAAILLFAALIWAAVSTLWSPFHPRKLEETTILKMAFELPLYGAAVLAARRADPALTRRALAWLAIGCSAFGVILLAEAASQAALYKTLRVFYAPIRSDLAEARIGHSTYVLGTIWPLIALGAPPKWRVWAALAMFAGVGAAALAFGSDAPVLGLVLAPLAALVVWRWPQSGPKLLAAVAVALFLGMPAVIWSVRHFFDYAALEAAAPKTDSMRMDYWSHAIDWIRLRPWQGWGLDASRVFGPGIRLHPHNAPLQVWLELGAVGAVLAAAFWGVTLSRLSGPRPSLVAAAAAACASVYLLFGVNFGVWQEWWVAEGALIALLAAANVRAAEGGGAGVPESTSRPD